MGIEIYSVSGTPQMETSAVLSIRVQQVVTMAPELGIGFTALKHEVSIDEGISEGTVVKVLELDQVPNPGLRLDCEIMRVKGGLLSEAFLLKPNFFN